MFDISFTELALCFVVALVVLGPEKLPKVARTMGRWTGQARAYMRNLTSELERETQVSEIKKQLLDAQQALRESADSVEKSGNQLLAEVRDNVKPPPEQGSSGEALDAPAAKPDRQP